MNDKVKLAINNVYMVFVKDRIDDLSKVGCFDFGPSKEELEWISGELRSIPDDVVGSMEFFGYGWETWGTKSDVKYFLPRLLEYMATDIERAGYPGLFSLFKYKLCSLFDYGNDDWDVEEKDCILKFFSSLVEDHFLEASNVGELVEVCVQIKIPKNVIVESISADKELCKKQVENIFDHFGVEGNCEVSHPEGAYCEDSGVIKELLMELDYYR